MIVLAPGRDVELNINPESIKSRMDKNKKLYEPVEDLAMYVSEGQAFADGLTFPTGADLAHFLGQVILFSICALQEQGYLNKALPKKVANKETTADAFPGQYL